MASLLSQAPRQVPEQLVWEFPEPFLPCLELALLVAVSILCFQILAATGTG